MQMQGIRRPADAIIVPVPFHYRVTEHQRSHAPPSKAVQGLAHGCTHPQRQPGAARAGIYKHGFIKGQHDFHRLPCCIALPSGRSGSNHRTDDSGCSVIRRSKQLQWVATQQLQPAVVVGQGREGAQTDDYRARTTDAECTTVCSSGNNGGRAG